MKNVWVALKRLEKAADRILGRKKKGITKWVSEIRQPNNENYAIAIILASPYSNLFEWKVIIVTEGREILAYEGITEDLEAAKNAVKKRVENLFIWNEENGELIWSSPIESADEVIGEALKGYRRWKVNGYLIVMRQTGRDKIEIEVIDPIKRIIYHRNVGNVGKEDELFGEAVNYIRRHLLAGEPKVEEITNE
jgi:hypothetical protein